MSQIHMYVFSNKNILVAGEEDIPDLVSLLNSAYRGESSRQGWTTEADLIAGNVRSDNESVKEVMHKEGSVFLKYTNDDDKLVGCVNLQQHGNKIYLGMFAVSPAQQGGGTGKQILYAAEEYAKHLNISCIYMSVISVRVELISWYKRHGYKDTGERKPFPEDGKTGKHLAELEFMMLEKNL